VSLFGRAVAVNTVLLVVAALVLALSPATVSPTVTAQEWIVLAIGTGLIVGVNVLLLRHPARADRPVTPMGSDPHGTAGTRRAPWMPSDGCGVSNVAAMDEPEVEGARLAAAHRLRRLSSSTSARIR